MNSFGGFAVVTIAYAIGIVALVKYFKTKKSLLPYIALMAFTCGTFSIGSIIIFFMTIVTGSVDYLIPGFIAYVSIPLAITNAMYVGFVLYNPSWTKRVVLVYSITGVVYYVAIFGFPTIMIRPDPSGIGTTLASICLYLAIFYVFSVFLVLGVGFLRLSRKMRYVGGLHNEYRKCIYLFFAHIFFGFGAILDLAFSSEFIIIARILLATCYFLLGKGYLDIGMQKEPKKEP